MLKAWSVTVRCKRFAHSPRVVLSLHSLTTIDVELNPAATMDSPNFRPSFLDRVTVGLFRIVNKYIPWHRLPSIIGALNLDAMRISLRANDLHDGYSTGAAQGNTIDEPLAGRRYLNARNSDGKFNSLEMPLMGCAGMRFGRNFPRQYSKKPTEKELWTPDPRVVSERLMARKKPNGFIPATSLNMLAAAWIQFQTHDWFFHDSVSDLSPLELGFGLHYIQLTHETR